MSDTTYLSITAVLILLGIVHLAMQVRRRRAADCPPPEQDLSGKGN